LLLSNEFLADLQTRFDNKNKTTVPFLHFQVLKKPAN
jgi:hypothetical protein